MLLTTVQGTGHRVQGKGPGRARGLGYRVQGKGPGRLRDRVQSKGKGPTA